MTRSTDADKAMSYLKKADGALRMAKIAIREKEYDSAVMGAVHGAINALDALTTSYLGKRASGAHTDVLSLDKGIFSPAEYKDVQKQFTSIISMKNASEYQPDLMNDTEAENAVRWAERIINKAKGKLKNLKSA